ncbi:MAG: Vms1/Ankzf1 family peptidyl-tRNA hydrolase [Rhodothermales bacterium]
MDLTFADLDLKTFADLEGPERAFLTLYLSSPESVRALDQQFRSIRSLLGGNATELEHFEQNVKLLQPLLDGLSFDTPSVAVFVCWALDVAKTLPLTVAVPDKVWMGSSPYIRPLAELQDEYEDFAVVVVDNAEAKVYFVHAAVVGDGDRVKGDVKNAVKKGGWSQKRYARRREKELSQYAAEVAETVRDLYDEEGFERLVLLGSQEAMQAVEEHLATPLRDRLVGERSVDVGNTSAVLKEAFAVYFEGERASEQALWDRVREGYLTGGLAVVGAQKVLSAAQQARVEVALIDREAKLKGTKCRDCEHLVYGTPDTCQRCGSSDVFVVDYVNELIETLARTGAEADFVDPFDGLTEVGGVAALLRY